MQAFKNIRLITESGVLEDRAVVFEDRIVEIGAEADLAPGIERLDGDGMYLAPGLIDLHIHGCAGYDTMDEDPRALGEIAKALVRTGVTAFLATTMTMEFRRIVGALERIRNYRPEPGGARILGCHLEGPFISRQYKGAQDETYILNPDFSLIEPYSDVIRMIAVAPEQQGSIDFIGSCCRKGIRVAIGHSDATLAEAAAAIVAGAAQITHTFNAMSPLHHREPGVVGAALLYDVTCELIADNIHVHPEMQRLLLKNKGLDRVVLITDAMRACLLQDGQYDLGGQAVRVHDGQARLGDGTLSGSVLTLDRAVRNFAQNTGLPPEKALRLATVNPANCLGFGQKGRIAVGKDADFVLLDEELNVIRTYVAGQLVYQAM